MSLHLHVMSGPDLGRSFPIMPGPEMLIGRSAHAYYNLKDPKVSRNHCQVILEGDQVTIVCNGGDGGTLVNGSKIDRQVLKLGDTLKVGQTQFQLRVVEHAPEEPDDEPLELEEELVPVEEVEPLTDLIGESLGQFEVGDLVGEGGNGAVFEATNTKTRQVVALKVLREEFGYSDESVKRFAAALKQVLPIRHRHIVPVLGAGKSGKYCWVAMERVEGKNMAQVVEKAKADGKPDWKRGYRVALHGARALQFIHAHDIIHGHITPANVFRETETKTVKLGDLMLAHALGGGPIDEKSTAKPPPDLPYMSPERTHGLDDVDELSDMYSLGATVHAVLSGQPPFGGRSVAQMVMRVREASPEKLTKFLPNLPPPFETVVMKMMAKSPQARFRTADELLAVLDRIGKQLGVIM